MYCAQFYYTGRNIILAYYEAYYLQHFRSRLQTVRVLARANTSARAPYEQRSPVKTHTHARARLLQFPRAQSLQ